MRANSQSCLTAIRESVPERVASRRQGRQSLLRIEWPIMRPKVGASCTRARLLVRAERWVGGWRKGGREREGATDRQTDGRTGRQTDRERQI
eukprot:4887407-Pleurochrysis_carterae.AAC.1